MTSIRILLAAALLALAGCATGPSISKVASGEGAAVDRVVFTLDAAWNQVNLPGRSRPVLWTQDGITVDALELWVGVADGQALVEQGKDKRPLVFKRGMASHEIVSLFEGLYSRDGSRFTLDRVAPETFLGGPGVRFDFTVLRKVDDVRVSGVGWAVVQADQLYALTFVAPRLAFFPRHIAKVEQVARAARLKD